MKSVIMMLVALAAAAGMALVVWLFARRLRRIEIERWGATRQHGVQGSKITSSRSSRTQ